MKILIILITGLTLSSCGFLERSTAYMKGYSKQCIEGVMYAQFTNGATVLYNRDSSIKTCN